MGKRGWTGGPIDNREADMANRLDNKRSTRITASDRVPTADRFRSITPDSDTQAVRARTQAAGPELGATFTNQRERRDHLTRIANNNGFEELARRIATTTPARLDLDYMKDELDIAIKNK